MYAPYFSPEQTPKATMETVVRFLMRTPTQLWGLDPVPAISLVLPNIPAISESLPLAGTLESDPTKNYIGNPGQNVRAAVVASHRRYLPNDKQTTDTRIYWMFDDTRGTKTESGLVLDGVAFPEAVALTAVASSLLGVKEGALRDIITKEAYTGPRCDPTRTNLTLHLVHAAFWGIAHPDQNRLFPKSPVRLAS